MKDVWCVACVYMPHDRKSVLVTSASAYSTQEAARGVARRWAEHLLQEYNARRGCLRSRAVAFDEAWTTVNNDGPAREYGYDPVDCLVSNSAVRVFRAVDCRG